MSTVTAHPSIAAAHAALGASLDDEAVDDVHFTWAWFEALQHGGLDPGTRVIVLAAQDTQAGSALCLPLLVAERDAAAVLGGAVTSLNNFYTSLFGPIAADADCTVHRLRSLIQELRRLPVPNQVLRLQPLDQDSAFYRNMIEALRLEGYTVDSFFCFGNWHLKVAGRSFDDYFVSVPSQIRKNVIRSRKKLEEHGAWELRIVTEPGDALEESIRDYETVYAASWKVPEPFTGFVPGLIRAAASRGWLRLGIVRLDGEAIASQIWLVRHRRALIYKMAYAEAHKRWSSGSVLSAALMRHVIDVDGVTEVDYLTGDDKYKADWMSHRRERRGLVAFRLVSPQGLLSAARHFLARWWRERRAPAPAAPQGDAR